jgi:TonB family protein
MVRVCLLIVSGILIASTSLFAQNSPTGADSPAVTKTSESRSGAEHGIYVSGFEILNPEKDPNALGHYPYQVLAGVRSKWYPQIPELQKSNGRKQGITAIEIEIGRDGSLKNMKRHGSSGDDSLDTAASKAISSSAPFARLPAAYHEKALKMRMHFGYDQPASADAPFCDGPNWGAHAAAYAVHNVGNGVTPPKAIYQPDPEYSEQARREKYMSVVRIAGTVDPQGAFTDLCLVQAAGAELDDKAMEAVKTWKFEPATLRGEAVAVRVHVEVNFRLY